MWNRFIAVMGYFFLFCLLLLIAGYAVFGHERMGSAIRSLLLPEVAPSEFSAVTPEEIATVRAKLTEIQQESAAEEAPGDPYTVWNTTMELRTEKPQDKHEAVRELLANAGAQNLNSNCWADYYNQVEERHGQVQCSVSGNVPLENQDQLEKDLARFGEVMNRFRNSYSNREGYRYNLTELESLYRTRLLLFESLKASAPESALLLTQQLTDNQQQITGMEQQRRQQDMERTAPYFNITLYPEGWTGGSGPMPMPMPVDEPIYRIEPLEDAAAILDQVTEMLDQTEQDFLPVEDAGDTPVTTPLAPEAGNSTGTSTITPAPSRR
ncbi:hypothetical protein H6771_01355 [Candidatus Peribacteria bacterium]|nr:hypothetical protein [Candidatus Peribacteria bacterium]